MKTHPYWLLFVVLIALATAAQDSRILHIVSGAVRGPTGQPMPGTQVQLRRWPGGEIIASTISTAGGEFEIGNVAPGRYEVVAASRLAQASAFVEVTAADGFVSLSIPVAERDGGSPGPVSVAQLKVPKGAQQAFEKASRALSRGDLEKARHEAENALAICPDHAGALTLRAGLELQQNRPQEAAADAEKAIASDPHYGLGYLVLSTIYNQQGRYDDALRVLNEGMHLSPQAWQGYYEMSKALLAKGNYAESLRQADRAWGLSQEKYAPILLVRAKVGLATKNYSSAKAELEDYLRREPHSSVSPQVREMLKKLRALPEAPPN